MSMKQSIPVAARGTILADLGRTTIRGFTRKRIVALLAISLLALGLAYLRFAPDASVSVPEGAQAGDLILEPCSYSTENGGYDADCGTLVVPENREDAGSRLIALPVTRVRASVDDPAEPIFRLEGGPGISNMTFPKVSRIADSHDVVLVGYRGVEGSSVLNCPEVVSALKGSDDLVADDSLRGYSEALGSCAERLREEGVDLDGYTLPQRVDDLEAVRVALGYDRINLISESVGTRTAMIYSWRYPESIHRSVMIAVNPPGHFLWPSETTDAQIRHYADLCSQDEACSDRTDDLAASIRSTAADMPDRWLFLPIKEGNVTLASFFGLMETTSEVAPLNAPIVLHSWLSAADGDSSGFWFMSFLADLAFPEAFVWGELAATAMLDAEVADAYYLAGGDPGSILGNSGTDFLFGGGGVTEAWPANLAVDEYRQVQTSDVETLLIGGTLDFATPAEFATNELLPFLPNGHQVVLTEFGHSTDFWDYQPEASARLINTFYDTGEVDDSLYTQRRMDFGTGVTHTALAKGFLGTMVGVPILAALSLWWTRRRANRRSSVEPKAGTWIRSVGGWFVATLIVVHPLILGLGGWFLATLIVMTIWPAVSLDNELIAVLSIGPPIGLGIYWAWVHRDWSAKIKNPGFGASMVGALVGAWAGFNSTAGLLALITAIVGAAIAANLALIVLDITRDRSARASDR